MTRNKSVLQDEIEEVIKGREKLYEKIHYYR